MEGWRYIAIRFNGDGSQTPLHWELPLTNPRIIDDLSGPGEFTAAIEPEVRGLRTQSGELVLVPWSTVILAEKDGEIRGGGILNPDGMTEAGPRLSLKCTGVAGYPQGMPYVLDNSWIDVDPMSVVRHIWEHLQSSPSGNLGVRVTVNDSPVRIGKPERENSFTTGAGELVEFTSGPYVLAWWKTHNLGREIDDLAKETPFQYRTTWAWEGDKAVPTIDYRYPSLGRRVHDARLVVGENVIVLPTMSTGESDYASDVLVLGAGSGRTIRNGSDTLPAKTRLRRVVVLEDKSIESNTRARQVAISELRLRQGQSEISELVVRDHPNARIGSFAVGDEILVSTSNGWAGDQDVWYKVISLEIDPTSDTMNVQVLKADKLG